jgi:hypothetical protein
MSREDKQLPSPPPDGGTSKYGILANATRAKHGKGSSSGSTTKRLVSGSSSSSTGQAKRTEYGSGTNGLKRIDINDDLLIRLLAQKALTDSQHCHILNPEEIEDLKNVFTSIRVLIPGTNSIEIDDRIDKSKTHIRTKSKTSSTIFTSS